MKVSQKLKTDQDIVTFQDLAQGELFRQSAEKAEVVIPCLWIKLSEANKAIDPEDGMRGHFERDDEVIRVKGQIVADKS